jgi:hypothetical protein
MECQKESNNQKQLKQEFDDTRKQRSKLSSSPWTLALDKRPTSPPDALTTTE